jgi:hypothetical protein
VRTHKTSNLWFQFRSVLPEGMDSPELAELLIHAGLIESCERDPETGEVTRYAETPIAI